MSIPGLNLLALASTVIAQQGVAYERWLANTTNAEGNDVPAYAAPVTVWGSFQPVSLDRIESLGLDMGRDYATFYATGAYRPGWRDDSPDRFTYGGRTWEASGVVDWFAQDGWEAVLMVAVSKNA